jgi:multidrug efflux pump subunit AcrB
MKNLVKYFVKNHRITITLTLFFLAAGALGIFSLKRETYPTVDFGQVNISTYYPGSSSEEVEERITRKIEDELRSVDGLKQISSISQSGLSSLDVRIDGDNFSNDDVVTELQRAVQRVNGLPADLPERPSLVEVDTQEIPVIEYALIGSNVGQKRNRLADYIKSTLEDLKGVSRVRMDGYSEREVHISLNPEKMRSLYVGINDVVRSVSTRLQNIPAGLIRDQERERLIRLRGKIDNIEELNELVIRSNFSGERILLGDVATIEDSSVEPRVLARSDGEPATLITILKKGEADSIATVSEIKKLVEKIRLQLPAGYKVQKFSDEGTKIVDRLKIVTTNTLTGLLLVVIILLIFLPGSLGLVSAMSIPLCILGTTAMLPIFGISFNTITMLGIIIVIGMLVDNTIVISENYGRLRSVYSNRETAASDAALQFFIPITATALTTVAAFLPMLVTKGVLGQFISGIPIVVSTALVICLFESFFLLPMRLKWTLRKRPQDDSEARPKSDWWDPIRLKFHEAIRFAVRRRYLVTLGMISLLIGCVVFTLKFNRFELFPDDGVELYITRFELPQGTNLAQTDKVAAVLSKQVEKVIGRENLRAIIARAGTSYGGPGDPGGANGPNVGGVLAYLPMDKAQLVKSRDVLKAFRGFDRTGFESLTFQAAANGPPVGKPVTLVMRGDNYTDLKGMANEVMGFLSGVRGVTDIKDDDGTLNTEYVIDIDYEKMSRLGLNNESVGLGLRSALQGVVVSNLNLEGKIIDVRVRYGAQSRAVLQSVLRTSIQEPIGGKLIPLSSFARIREDRGPPIIQHFDFKRAITITANVVPEEITSIEANSKVREYVATIKAEFPEVLMKFGGEEENTKESFESLVNAMILAFLGIGVILIFVFNSYSKPLLVISTIPLGLVGVSLAFYFHDRPLSFLALIGVVGLAGVVVNSAIVLVAYIEELRKKTELSLHAILAKAASDRLRAILATGLTTIGGFLPTAYGMGGSDPFLVPMVLALAWGLLSGTLLQLIWIPCMYAILADLKKFVDSRFPLNMTRTPKTQTVANSMVLADR